MAGNPVSGPHLQALGPDWLLGTPPADGPSNPWTLVLAQGAAQGMDSPFMASMVALISARGLRVLRFELPYMRAQRRTGVRRPPDLAVRLMSVWHLVLDSLAERGLEPEGLLIGGKSLGGRMASLVAGLVCLGYPFHPPSRPGQTRIEHLRDLQVLTLICQGTRDPFGLPEEVAGYALSPAIRLGWIEDADHSFKPSRGTRRTWDQNLGEAAGAVAAFVSVMARAGSARDTPVPF